MPQYGYGLWEAPLGIQGFTDIQMESTAISGFSPESPKNIEIHQLSSMSD